MKTTMSKSIFFFICLTANVFVLSAQGDTILTTADQMPYFMGCDDFENGSDDKRECSNVNLISFISENLVYPEKAKANQVDGTVYVNFVVNKQGVVTEAQTLRDIGHGCGEAALNVIRELPRFEPAMNDGQPVMVKMNIPIRFNLSTQEVDLTEGYTITWGSAQGQRISKETIKNNLEQTVVLRDDEGNIVNIDELVFAYERNEKIKNAKSRGETTKDLQKIASKVKIGDLFIISASIQIDGEFLYVDNTFEVVE